MPSNVHKYCAWHTLALILLGALLVIIMPQEDRIYVSIDDFETIWGKVLFALVLIYTMIPVFINMLVMFLHILKQNKWLWLLGFILLSFGATAPYYFLVYRTEEGI